jgi:His Kinase A (phospho-acceptor) domain
VDGLVREDAGRGPDVGRFPWLVARLRRGPVHFAGLDELSSEAAIDCNSFARLGISSAIIVPLIDGTRLLGALTFSVQRRAHGRPADLLERLEFVGGIFSGLLLRRRNEVELQKLRRDLTHVGRVSTMGELAAALAHELNQPLTAILTNAQVAERLLDKGVTKPTELREILADIVADDKRAGEVIRRLRGFLKKDPPRRSSLDLNAVIQDVVLLVHSDAIIRNVTVVLDLAPGLPPVHADRVQLQQVVLLEPHHERAGRHARRGGPSSWHRDARQRGRESAGVGQRSGRRSPGGRPAAGLRRLLHDEGPRARHGTLHRPIAHPGARRPGVGAQQRGCRHNIHIHPAPGRAEE